MEERRLSQRTKIDCNISVISDYRILVFNTEVENIGEGGIRVLLKEKLEARTKVDIEIYPPDKGFPLKCRGEVIWINEKKAGKDERVFDSGIKFTDISLEQQSRIRKW